MPEIDDKTKIKWLISIRILFSFLLLGSAIIQQMGKNATPMDRSLVVLYGLIAAIFLLSVVYSTFVRRVKNIVLFAFIQTVMDTFFVTLIVFLTGGFVSVFSFLYLVVIIYASMLLPMWGAMVIAALCSLQFGAMVELEYFGLLSPIGTNGNLLANAFDWSQIFFKLIITMTACFAVAFLSSLLSEQTRKTKEELRAMEGHVKRVEKMAAIGEMAAGLAHEIKNPLAALTGSIQLLKEDMRYDSDQARLMQIILREADRLSSLASSFLFYARPPAGKVEPIDLNRALLEIVELFEIDGSNNGRVKTIKKISSDVWITMDPGHLHQILWNLLLNAAEAIDGDGNIEIEMFPIKNKYACVKISDNGCGISAETLKTIFDPFFTTKPNGTGLGLSIVHRILEANDAWLNVESQLNKGTTVTLHFKQIAPPR
ncbi:MAG: two-component sensor histidine kinase [Deltaproteobacteria bacterium]|jgi:two-component system sensor histidine kinase PilS (NtrC family)|nr:two-component sensor histidine kinase [Deltaproteobacteria bacterium]MBW2517715.1 two-component sensor histidine kinase [Deltaproteobacteria bacterium]